MENELRSILLELEALHSKLNKLEIKLDSNYVRLSIVEYATDDIKNIILKAKSLKSVKADFDRDISSIPNLFTENKDYNASEISTLYATYFTKGYTKSGILKELRKRFNLSPSSTKYRGGKTQRVIKYLG